MQVVTGTRGWFMGGGHAVPRRSREEEPLPALRLPDPVPLPAPMPPGEPATLRQLGLPQELAHDLEVALRAMGATLDGRVVGFTFRAPDQTRHEVVLETSGTAPGRAA
jgi:hypothetical protein